jgi:hypothetical protein
MDTQTPCKRGHVGFRTSFGKCSECVRILTAVRYQKNKEKRKEINLTYYYANREKMLASQKWWRAQNPETSKASMLTWQKKNREQMLETAKIYRQLNTKKHLALQTKRKTAILKRIPKWADLEQISSFYQNCPPGMSIDHIIPLQGKLVSGLHVMNNLQYLPLAANIAKNNKFDPDSWREF